MSLWKMALRSIQQRGTASLLTMFSMALAVALITAVMICYGAIGQSFSNAASGYNIIVGAKGGALELTLNTVYHIGRPIENIPLTYYKQFRPGGRFAPVVETAIPVCMGDNFDGYRVVATVPEMFTDLEYAPGEPYRFASGRNFGADAAHDAGEHDHGDDHDHSHGHDHARAHAHDHGAAKPAGAAPPAMVAEKDEDIKHDHDHAGHEHHAPPHFNEAVIGSLVARNTGMKVGSQFKPNHGLTNDSEMPPHEHDPVEVVGVLEPTGTPNDQAIFMNIEGFYLLDGHSKSGEHHHDGPLPEVDREVTAILVKTKPEGGMDLYTTVNGETIAQAALPVRQTMELFEKLVHPVMVVLLVVAMMIFVVAGIGIVVSIYNSMNERRREIAIMRSLGAGKSTVLTVVMFEALLLGLGGAVGGFVLGHLLSGLASPYLVAETGIQLGFLQFPTFEIPLDRIGLGGVLIVPIELVLLPSLVLLAGLIGFVPGMAAYKTDVSRALANSN